MKGRTAARRPRNPVARAVRSPQYRMRTEEDKRHKLRDKLPRKGPGNDGGDAGNES